MAINTANIDLCAHCGEKCENETFTYADKSFCCLGCKTVYEILDENDLCTYYDIDEIRPFKGLDTTSRYEYLENPDIEEKILSFSSTDYNTVTLEIPGIHCSSCIWLLEKLYKLHPGILRSEVNFTRKTITINYRPGEVSLRAIAELLARINYPPSIHLDSGKKDDSVQHQRSLLIRVGITGFLFGNIMMLSFPEYLGIDTLDAEVITFINWLNVMLSLPVMIIGGKDYLVSAYKSLRHKSLNIDVPIAVGIVTLFGESLYQVIAQTGPGYWDSLSGLIFFLIVGKWFQELTYQYLSFERDFKSYFPLSVYSVTAGKFVPIQDLQKEDHIEIRNNDIIPADCMLISGQAHIDYSFVTGESDLIGISLGEKIYAGGKHVGGPIELAVLKEVSSSYLTQLWEKATPLEDKHQRQWIDKVATYFTPVILFIGVAVLIYWQWVDPTVSWQAFTSVLIVACPCALALAAPFTYGNLIRLYGKIGCYLKNSRIIETLGKIDRFVFDKTGTLTTAGSDKIEFQGYLNSAECDAIKSVAACSSHPISKKIYDFLGPSTVKKADHIQEVAGSGISAKTAIGEVAIGSWQFAKLEEDQKGTFVTINGHVRGKFLIADRWRDGLAETFGELRPFGNSALLSGDHKPAHLPEFIVEESAYFSQTPYDKLEYIEKLQKEGHQVMMVGDGLNDGGALLRSNIGVAITDDKSAFTPSSDIILESRNLKFLPRVIRLAKSGRKIVTFAVVLSFLYNIVGLSFAVTGNLSPVIAAILMPISSISVVVFTTLASSMAAKNIGIIK